MRKTLLPLFLSLLVLQVDSSAQTVTSAGAQAQLDREPVDPMRKVGYFIEWGIYGRDYQPLDIPADKVTHINYAFANIGTDLRIQIGDPYAAVEKIYPGDVWNQPYAGTYNQLNNVLRAQHPHIKTFISVGGWTWSGRFSDAALTAGSRQAFASSCVDFIRAYNFDGVDLDWEYPVGGGLASNVSRPEDKHNYTLLARELRSQLDAAELTDGREYLLTIAAAAGYDKIVNYEPAALAMELDWINVMTYDLRGAWDLSISAHHSPLFANPADPATFEIATRYNVDFAMNEWAAAGVPKRKLVMGMPFYGRAWGGVSATNNGLFQSGTHVPPGTWDDWSSGATGFNEFWEIQQFEQLSAYSKHRDRSSEVPFLFSPSIEGGHFISYDDEISIRRKTDYVKAQGFGGAMFWEFSSDRNQDLIDVINDELR
jgi:chitinase